MSGVPSPDGLRCIPVYRQTMVSKPLRQMNHRFSYDIIYLEMRTGLVIVVRTTIYPARNTVNTKQQEKMNAVVQQVRHISTTRHPHLLGKHQTCHIPTVLSRALEYDSIQQTYSVDTTASSTIRNYISCTNI